MESSRDYTYYKEHAQDVNLEDITSSQQNKNILQKLRDGDSEFTCLYILDDERNGDDDEFIACTTDDLGWLGYFIGESVMLEFLRVAYNGWDPIPICLLGGICRNRSIQDLEIKNGTLADTTSFHLASFFDRNYRLTSFTLGCFHIGSDSSARNFVMALVKCKNLKRLVFEGSPVGGGQFSDDAFRDIIVTALKYLPQLEGLYFEEHYIERDGYAALSNALKMGGMGNLQNLNLTNSHVDDDAMVSLVTGMRHCRHLVGLNIFGNNEITDAGLRTLSGFFRSEACNLESLNFGGCSINDEMSIVLATGLTNYKPLKHLVLSDNLIGDEGVAALVSGITTAANTNLETLYLSSNRFNIAGIRSVATLVESGRSRLKILDLGWMTRDNDASVVLANALANNTSLLSLGLAYISDAGATAFSTLLCDTSSIKNIYSSNHTLEMICDFNWPRDTTNDDIKRYLMLNRSTKLLDPKYSELVPMCKILIHYPDLGDMKPFYQWKLKFLPMIASWFWKASSNRNFFEESVEVFQRRKLSGLYKFIRGVPQLVADGYWSQQLEQIHLKKRNFQDTEEQLLMKLLAKKRKLQEEEMRVLDRLSGKRATV